jgi:hypothetical protein
VISNPSSAQGTADIVWQHWTGQVHYWPMRNGQRQGGTNVFAPVGNDWALRGVGDVDGDGTADIVWQHWTGQVHYWPMRNGQRQGGTNVFTPVGNDWALRGVGDVDGDGTADIVWQHISGQVHFWPMRNGQRQGGTNVFTPVGNDWALRGVGDVDGDGTADIVWQHISGQVHYWPMRNGQRQGGTNVFTPVGNDWTLRGVGDVDGDRNADIVWQHVSGQVHYWPMRNGQRQGGINVFTPVGNDWVLRAVGDVDGGGGGVVHRLQISRYTTAALTNADADRILGDATTVLRTSDGPDDVATDATMQRNGDVTTFTAGDGSIDSSAEFGTVIGLPGQVKVVNQINWCGSLIPNVIGCAPVPGGSLAVVRFTANLEGILWAHEYGHNKGRGHRDDPNAVMNGVIGSTHRRVNAEESTAFLTLPATGAVFAAGPPQPAGTDTGATGGAASAQAGGGPQQDVRDFVRQVFIHGMPFEQATRYGTAAVPTLLDMLRDPAEEEHWPNIAVMLGMIGDERAVEPMIAFIEAGGQDRLSPAHYRAKTSALMSLGYVVNRNGNQRALAYLRDSVQPDVWAQRSIRGNAPFQASTEDRNADFSKHAVLGLALAGRPEAAQVLRSLQQPAATDAQRAFQAQVGDLVTDALAENERISREGLAGYYRSRQ